tara:strand:- start:10758 stop:11660 length:903 start_codon:yes stop_codon:yes gene_type:complete
VASLRLRLLTFGLRTLIRPALARCATPFQARVAMARGSAFFRPPPFLLHLPGRSTSQPDQISVGRPHDHAVILYLHGGAYLAGSPATHAAMLGRLAKLTGLRILAPDYRLAPENPAPAAFEDANVAFLFLLDQGYRPDQIVLGGDSAGGGLALALLSHLCRKGLQPLALFAFSPWTDLTLSGKSIRENARRDPLLPVERIIEAVGFVRGGLATDDPRLSPLFARFDSPPPCLLFVGSTEILRDDTLRMAKHLQSSGAAVKLHQEARAPHVWPLFDGYIPEARAALQMVSRFIAAQIETRL